MMELAKSAPTAADWPPEQYLKIFKPEQPVTRHALIVEDAGQTPGFVVGRESQGGEWELENLVVAAAARRRGLGMRLLQELLRLANAKGATAILLEARESNQAARSLYLKWGACESGKRPGYYQNPKENAILYKFSSSSQVKKSSK